MTNAPNAVVQKVRNATPKPSPVKNYQWKKTKPKKVDAVEKGVLQFLMKKKEELLNDVSVGD